MNKKTGESTTTHKVDYPQYIQDAQKLTTNIAGNLAAPFLENVPKHAIAGLNADQLKAMELARGTAQQVAGTNYADDIMSAATAGQGLLGGMMGAPANTVSGDDIVEMMNPYLDEVGEVTLDKMRREYQNANAMNNAQFANEQAFGGSGAALARARMARDYNEGVGSMISGLRHQGYNTAQGAAFQNAALEEAAANRNAQLASQHAALGMQGAQGANQAFNDNINRQILSQGLLGAAGDKQQAHAQSILDLPWTMLGRFQSTFPGAQANTSTSQPIYSNPLGTIAGAGMTLLGGF